jgi:WD40 repeat protein
VSTTRASVVLVCVILVSGIPVAARSAEPPKERTDASGDSLPADAALRLGSTRLRHSSAVEALAFSSDGRLLASADYWGVVRVWDAQTGKMRLELPKGSGTNVVFSPDGKLLATGGDNTSVRLWDAATGEEIRSLRGNGTRATGRSHAARCLAFSPDNKALLFDDGKTSVVLCEVESGKELRRFEGLKYTAHAVAFSPDGKSVAAGDSVNNAGGESTIIVWDAASGEQRCKIIDAKQGWVYGLAFSPDNKVLASATPYHVCLWDAANGKRLKEFAGGVSGAVAFDKAGKRLVTGGDVCVIDPTSHEIVRRMGQGGNFAFAAALSPDGKTIASNAVYDERIRLWDAETGKEKLTVAGHLDEVRDVAFSPDGKRIATASGGDGTVRLWDAARGIELHVLKLKGELNHFSRGRQVTLTFSADGRTLSAAGHSWDVATGKETEPPSELRGRQGACSPDGRTVALIETAIDKYPVVVLRDGPTGRLLRRLPTQGEQGRLLFNTALAFSPDGRLLATGCKEEMRGAGGQRPPTDTVRVWDVATGKLLRAFRSDTDMPAHVVFSPDGALVATSRFWQHPAQLWDVSTGKEVRKLRGHEDDQRGWDEFNPVAFSPDGGLLATGGKDNRIVIWETSTGEIARLLAGHSRPVRALAFSPDGKALVSCGADTAALVWPVVPPGAARKWSADKADELWKALEGKAADAFPLVWALAAAPEQAVPFLAERLRPEAAADERQLARWIDDLGHDKFPVREEAMNRLRELGARAEPALRKALADQKDAERRRRLEELIAKLAEKGPDTVLLRDLRAILALEQMGTPAAEKLLEKLARARDGGPRTGAAQAALVRLESRRERGRARPASASENAPRGREPRQLYAHDGEVRAVAFTPDGKTALSAAQDGKVRRWDVMAAKELPALAGHEGGTFALALSPDGKRLASAGADGRVRLWDLRTGGEVASLAGHKGTVYAVAFSPDGKLLASGGADGTARIWDVDKKEERQTMQTAQERVTSVVFSADGERLMTGSVKEWVSHVDNVPCLHCADQSIRIWKVATGAEVRKLDQRGSALALTSDQKHLLVVSMRTSMVGRNGERGMSNDTIGIISLLDVSTDKAQVAAEGYGGAAALSADGRLLATARGSDLHIGEKVRHRDTNPDPGALRLWETLTGQEVLRFSVNPAVLAFAPDGRHLLLGTRAGAVCLVETAPPGVGGNGKLDRKALETFWADLASGDAAVAYRAQQALSAAREEAPAFLAERLRPAAADDAILKRLVADLDNERYVVRRAALAELARRGGEAEPALRAAVKRTDSPQVKQQLENLLAAPAIKVFPDPLRRSRAAQVLERIGTPEAKKVLADLPPIPEPRGENPSK